MNIIAESKYPFYPRGLKRQNHQGEKTEGYCSSKVKVLATASCVKITSESRTIGGFLLGRGIEGTPYLTLRSINRHDRFFSKVRRRMNSLEWLSHSAEFVLLKYWGDGFCSAWWLGTEHNSANEYWNQYGRRTFSISKDAFVGHSFFITVDLSIQSETISVGFSELENQDKTENLPGDYK